VLQSSTDESTDARTKSESSGGIETTNVAMTLRSSPQVSVFYMYWTVELSQCSNTAIWCSAIQFNTLTSTYQYIA